MSTPKPKNDGFASDLELSLIVGSIFASFILYSISVKAASKIYGKGRRPHQFALIFFSCAICAVGLIIATITLGYKQKISLDAIAAVVFALIPGLVSFPRDAIMEVLVCIAVYLFNVFPVRYRNFSYVTFGRACREDMLPNETPFPGCSGKLCTAHFYIRKLMLTNFYCPKLSNRIYRWKKMQGTDEEKTSAYGLSLKKMFTISQKNTIRWNSLILQHKPSVITVRNLLPVPEQKWYLALSSASWLVMQPWKVHFSRPGQVGYALRILSDIISIGRLIILFRGKLICKLVQDLDFDEEPRARVALQICNSLIEEIGLKEWGQLDVEQVKRFELRAQKQEKLGEIYSIILLLVIFKSNHFGDWFHHSRGQEERDDLFNFWECTHERFSETEGISFRSEYIYENDEVEDPSSSKYEPYEELDIKEEDRSIETNELWIRLFTWIFKILQIGGWLIMGTVPFDAAEAARFRYAITSFVIIKKIQKAASDGASSWEIKRIMKEQVDRWLVSCNFEVLQPSIRSDRKVPSIDEF